MAKLILQSLSTKHHKTFGWKLNKSDLLHHNLSEMKKIWWIVFEKFYVKNTWFRLCRKRILLLFLLLLCIIFYTHIYIIKAITKLFILSMAVLLELYENIIHSTIFGSFFWKNLIKIDFSKLHLNSDFWNLWLFVNYQPKLINKKCTSEKFLINHQI